MEQHTDDLNKPSPILSVVSFATVQGVRPKNHIMKTKSNSRAGNSNRNTLSLTATMLFSLVASVPCLAGPVSELYLTAGQERMLFVVQGTNVVRSWPVRDSAYAISVMDTVQITIGASGFGGDEYTLDGVATGVSFLFPDSIGTSIYDGTSDGTHLYAWDFNQNRVLQFDSTWANPLPVFSIAGSVGDFLGIAYDRTNNSFWISGWNKSEIRNYSATGQLLSSFSVSHNQINALALDPATGTLWAANGNVWGLFEEYSKSGVSLSTQYYPQLSGMNVLGAEFQFQSHPDTTPPQIRSIAATPSVLWPPNGRMVQANVTVDAVDNDRRSPVSRIVQVTSSEPQNPAAPDWEITGPLSVNLRADRLGNMGGRTYTISVECKDASGNLSSSSVTVSVPHENP